MPESVASYPYNSPHQMRPMLPGEHKLDGLRLLAAEVIAGASQLVAHGMPRLRSLLREALRFFGGSFRGCGRRRKPIWGERCRVPSLQLTAT